LGVSTRAQNDNQFIYYTTALNFFFKIYCSG